MNKCAKFHKYSPSDKKVKFNLSSAIEFGDGRFCVKLCIETLCKRATSVAHLTNFSFEGFYESFTEDASLRPLYNGAKKITNDQKLKSRGSCFNRTIRLHFSRMFPDKRTPDPWRGLSFAQTDACLREDKRNPLVCVCVYGHVVPVILVGCGANLVIF